MRTTALGVMLLGVAAAPVAYATMGTCTITRIISTTNLGLSFPTITAATGLAMPVEFDAAAGTFSMSRDAWANQFGPAGAVFATGFGPNGFLIMPPGAVTGTIDAAGNITLPNFASAFATDFCPPRSPDYPISPDLTTGLQFGFVSGAVSPQRGVPIEFTTGQVTLEGLDLIPDACGAGAAILSGFRVICVLSPIPDQAALPPAPSLALRGGIKIGKPLPATPPPRPDKGDILTLGGLLADWPRGVDPAEDLYVRSGDLLLLRVPAGRLQPLAGGTKLKVVDTDGTAITVLTGRKKNATVESAPGGTIQFKRARAGWKLKLRVQGLDLAALTPAGEMTIASGPYSGTDDVTVAGSGRRRKIR